MQQLITHVCAMQQQLEQLAEALTGVGLTLKAPPQQAHLQACWMAINALHQTHTELVSLLPPGTVLAERDQLSLPWVQQV